MSKSTIRRVGISLSAAAILVGAVACDSDDKKDDKSAPQSQSKSEPKNDGRSPVQALQAAFKKTSAAKSAKVHMTMEMPAGATPGAPSGPMVMDGVQGWNPTVVDMAVSGAALAGKDGPGATRMIMLNNVMYMQMPAKAMESAPAEMRGKKWMKIDVAAAAKESGNPALQKQLTGNMNDMNQDPAKQMAVLLDSPNLKHLGAEKVNGVDAQHYKGTLTVEEMIKGNESTKLMDPKDREQLLENVKKAGIKSYDMEFWLNNEDLPVKMTVGMDSAQGKIKIAADYKDYGAKADVQAPPAGETLDLMEMMKGLKDGSAAGSGAGA
ncbi:MULTISPECIES: hypothetical protein [Streptomyces]|uniref:hypothetical protein n=1 Tax=Streptomyces TaxID=1883 RepID=UPI00163BF0BE|nr:MULTISPECIES: hypothetical protein [Streptomyces]MBC2877422.1 hypothetical protein [Streptomyces sp. TYQ1024]UBI38221.1 hypothetical protein K7I03_18360 [Streptomyces mobaraensis]UKW30807.1 hypothetical protein MCU78_18320 [Streptomyces sp. TYQ1024]